MPSKSILALSLLLVTLILATFNVLNHFNKFNVFVRAGTDTSIVTKSATYESKLIANPTTIAKTTVIYKNQISPIQNAQLKAFEEYNQLQKQSIQVDIEKIAKANTEKEAAEKANQDAEQKLKDELEAQLKEKAKLENQKAQDLIVAQQQAMLFEAQKAQAKTVSNNPSNSSNLKQYAQDQVCINFGCENWSAFDYIIDKESKWNPLAVNLSSGACGLGQALPCSKMASYGADYSTNGKVQIDWTINYIRGRYVTANGAKAFWLKNYWY